MGDRDRARIHLEGMAAWTELEATVAQLVAASLRNDGNRTETLRQKAHDLLDQHFDLKIAGISAIRADLLRKIDEQ